MQHVRASLKKISADILRSEGEAGPLLAWPVVCGGKVAYCTKPLSYADGVLTIAVPDDGWRQQLQSFIPQYLAALKQMVQEPVSKIEFRTVPREG